MEFRHEGVLRKSGRYPWGSGKDPEQRGEQSLRKVVSNMTDGGMTEKEVAESMGLTIKQLRARQSIEANLEKQAYYTQVQKYRDKGMSASAIAVRMGKNESTIRGILEKNAEPFENAHTKTVKMLREEVSKNPYLDVGIGAERHLGITRTRLETAIEEMKMDGYKVHYTNVEQLGTGKKTSLMVLTKDDVDFKTLMEHRGEIKGFTQYSEDRGHSYLGLEPVNKVSQSRVKVRFAEDGGALKDGVIELRQGVPDISLGQSKYAQVRIGVEGDKFLKGMAIYGDIPDGYDIVYNSNKSKHKYTDADAMKSMLVDATTGKIDTDNPFGATVRQKHYVDKDGKKKLSSLNIIMEEGQWHDNWSKSLSAQMLSKQPVDLAKSQLGKAYEEKKKAYDDIMSLTNPVIKSALLKKFSDEVDSAAVHMKAAALPRSGWHVLLPVVSTKENEIYAPNFKNGEKVVIIRYPHAGIFEIPELTVNNKNKEAIKHFGNAKDAVGIHPKTAEKLSGADFDGDAGLVCPNNNGSIKTAATLKQLQNFDPKALYPNPPGVPVIKPRTKQKEMGVVSNLITDMTIKGAPIDDIALAVRHSMVVIDSEKHKLNYRQSAKDHDIARLKATYQNSSRGGASTIISKAASDVRVDDRKTKIDPLTGKYVHTYTGKTYINSQGRVMKKTSPSSKMYETDDARKLSSGTEMEGVYADHANKLKSLGNDARRSMLNQPRLIQSPSAAKVYASEKAALDAKLNIALMNAPKERQALIMSNAIVSAKRKARPDMTKDQLKKIKGQALAEARVRCGAKKETINITDKEWEAIQSGAISHNKLSQIINNADNDRLIQLATPRKSVSTKSVNVGNVKSKLKNGYTMAEIAESEGISTAALYKIIKEV